MAPLSRIQLSDLSARRVAAAGRELGLEGGVDWGDRRRDHITTLTSSDMATATAVPPPKGIPGVLIHGRRDISSPAAIAWELHRRWPGSTLHIDDSNGHGGSSMAQTWRAAHDELTTQLRH